MPSPTGDPGHEADTGGSVLVVDDDPFIARLLEIELKAAGYDVRVANNGRQALELAQERCPELVVADVMMPSMDGFELTRQLRLDQRTASVGVIMLTARGLSADKVEGFAVGADDYVVKPFDTPELLARIRGTMRRAKELRVYSPLTGLPGNARIEEEIDERLSSGTPMAVLATDLVDFRAYNAHYGFERGDEAIAFTAKLIGDVIAEGMLTHTFVGHVGGDDFVVICDAPDGADLAERLVARFDEGVLDLYDPPDRVRRSIEVESRRGEPQQFPVVTIAIGVATTEQRWFEHHAEMLAVATEMREYARSTPGSSWAIDHRTA
ncbi:MAG TPA: response regulator [Actinomycetota bacterium]